VTTGGGDARAERDLYRRLLELGLEQDLGALLREALGLIVEVTAARFAYLEVRDDDEPGDATPRWSIAHGLSPAEVEEVRGRVSRGVIAYALASGATIVTPSARLDPRFRGRASVQAQRIEQVLCAPIGSAPPIGVLYLEGRAEGALFGADDRARAELFARHLAPTADRLLGRGGRVDPTLRVRRALRLDGLVGRSAALASLLGDVALVAPLDVHVLLSGATGTGKSQIARIIHKNGRRSCGPFVEVNCAALPEPLLESELFGAEPGAHSTAQRRMTGKVAAAEGGTLLLDEVDQLSPACQAKVLHLLHARRYHPLGAAQAVDADVRILAATNANLHEAVARQAFRQDLLYRLEVLPIRVPSLAERLEDVAPLAAHFCARTCACHGFPALEVGRGAVRAAESAAWPGNVRQLEHAIEAAVIRAAGEGMRVVGARHLFPDAGAVAAAVSFQEATRRFQADLVRRTLAQTSGHVGQAADQLALGRSELQQLIQTFGLTAQEHAH
jgi:DNA-binding NtrC family response regulator